MVPTGIEEPAVQMLRSLLGIQIELREQATGELEEIQQKVYAAMESIHVEKVEARIQANDPIQEMPARELVKLFCQLTVAKVRALHYNLASCQSELQEFRSNSVKRSEFEELQEEQRKLLQESKQLQKENSHLLEQITDLSKHPEPHKSDPQKVDNSGEAQQELSRLQQSDHFSRDKMVIEILGETGLSRLPRIKEEIAKRWGLFDPASGSIRSALRRLQEDELVIQIRPWNGEGSSTGGRYPDIVYLSKKGEAIFTLITQKQPRPSSYLELLKWHKSPEHTLLNMQTADLLQEEGYRVDRYPPEIPLEGEHIFLPDLIAYLPDNQRLYIEVERGTHKSSRRSKWLNFYQVSQGRMYVVCDNRSAMRRLRSEIINCIQNRPGTLSLTNLHELRSGKRGSNGSIWLDVRER